MEPRLLKTKLFRPPTPPGWVARPALNALLEAGVGRAVTLVTAPAGSGKSTAVSAWLAARAGASAWVTLDERDDDPGHVLRYLLAALQSVEPNLGQDLQAALGASHPIQGPALSAWLVDVLSRLAQPLVLALDDYHAVSNPAVHALVRAIVDDQPPALHLVLIARHAPPLPLARWRLREALSELGEAALRFDAAEAAQLLERAGGVDLGPGELAELQQVTEGWIAGLRMVAISLRSGVEPRALVRTLRAGRHEHLATYLLDEVLGQLDPALRAFLQRTSVLRRLSAPLCAALSDEAGAGRRLDELARANLFTTPLDAESRWYRYHPLFREFLLARLEHDQPELVPELHRRAAAWHRQAGDIADALEHLFAAGELEQAAQVVEAHWRETYGRGELETVQSWLARLPPALVRGRSELALAQAWPLAVTGKIVQASLRAGEALAALDGLHEGPERDQLAGELDTLRALLALLEHQLPLAAQLAESALSRLAGDQLMLRSIATMNLGLCALYDGDVERAQQLMRTAGALGERAEDLALVLMPLGHLAAIQLLRGRLELADQTYRRALELATGWGRQQQPIAALAHEGLARVALERFDLADAEQQALEALALSEPPGLINFALPAWITLAYVHQARGNRAAAQATLRHLRMLGARHPQVPGVALQPHLARLALLLDELPAAAAWAASSPLTATSPPALLLQLEPETLTLAWIRLAEGLQSETLGLLGQLTPLLEASGRRQALLEARTLEALAHQALGQHQPALAALGTALELAAPGGYVHLLLAKGERMHELLRAWQQSVAARTPEVAGHVARLLAATGQVQAAASTEALVEPLTARELELLRMIGEGLSNAAIADQLVLSMSTVKWHLGNLFGKLAVRSRTQALVRARTLGLI